MYVSVQFSSVAQSCPTLWNPMNRSMPGFPVHHQLPELSQIQVHRVRDAIQLSHPHSSPSPPAFSLSQHQGLFQWVSASNQVEKDWSFSFSISPSNVYSGLISFRIDWFDLLAVQETLKSLLQHHSSKASILRCSAFFTVQLSHPYMTTGAFQNTWPWQHLDFRLLASKATKTIHFYCFKPSSLWNFVTSTLENIQIEKELDKSGW